MATKTIKKSAKTGKIVTDEFAEKNPDTTYKAKVVKKDSAEVASLRAAIDVFNADVNANDIDRQKLLNRCEAVDPALRETISMS